MVAPVAARIAAEAKKLSPKPIQYIVNTQVDPDHVGGNEMLLRMSTPPGTPRPGGGVVLLAHENVLNRMSR